MTVTFDPPLVVSGDFEVKIGSSGELFTTINGGSSTSQGSGLSQYHTLGSNITVSNFTYTSSTRPVLYSVRVNGSTLLTDPVVRNGDAAATNFNPFNTDINTVRGQETGYATLNPLRYSGYTTSDRIFTDGNLRMLGRGDGVSNFGATTGKFYAEVFVERIKSGESGQGYIGVIAEPERYAERGWPTNKVAALRDSGGGGSNNFYGDGKGTTTTTWTEGDTISVAFDADAAKVWIAKNGQYINGGNPATGATPSFSGLTFKDYYFLVSDNKPSSNPTTDGNRYQINFGQKPFKYAPPDGFQPLTTTNVRPETVITRPDQYVGIVTYTGDGQTTHSINGLNFNAAPDFVWIKNRDDSEKHVLHDTVRAVGNTLYTTSNDAADTGSTYSDRYKSFDFNGFTVGSTHATTNKNTIDFVAWCWRAGGAPTADNTQTSGAMTANSVSLDGVLQSAYTPSGSPSTYPKRMSIGTKQGFSIVQFVGNATNRTLPHGLGKPAKFMIVKNMDTNSTGWAVYHDAIGATETNNYIEISNGSAGQDDTAFQDTAPTSDVFSIGTKAATNNDTDNTIAWIWADVPGLQKFGQFEGNGNDNGPFIELGFRPALLFLKCVDNSGDNYDWRIIDSEREKFNDGSGSRYLIPHKLDNEADNSPIDFLSNGFKIRSSTGEVNENSHTFVYAAWAAAPSIDLFGGGANAR